MEKSFEELLGEAKDSLNKLNNNDLSLKDGLELYKEGISNLNKAQELLEEAKKEYLKVSENKGE